MHELIHWLPALLFLLAGAVLFCEDVQVAAAPVTVTTNTETLVVTSFPLTWSTSNGKAAIRGWMDLKVGTGTTDITIAIYRGSAIGGPLVGTKNPESGDFTPDSTAHFEVEFVDVLENVGESQYCMSVTQTGATGNGTVLAALIDTKVLSG